jgi:hypothetical protein
MAMVVRALRVCVQMQARIIHQVPLSICDQTRLASVSPSILIAITHLTPEVCRWGRCASFLSQKQQRWTKCDSGRVSVSFECSGPNAGGPESVQVELGPGDAITCGPFAGSQDSDVLVSGGHERGS